MWIAQHVGREIRVLNYYEAVGQPMAAHATWLRENRYTPDTTQIYLPHDGVTRDRVYSVSYESAFQDMGYSVDVIKNQGAGAAMARVEAGRRMFPSMWFNEETTAGGIEALGWYHEKRDDVRQIGLGAEHDWASHGADSFGLMAVVSEQEFKRDTWRSGDIDYSNMDKRMRA
jgi:phage terminase large subunit